MSTRAQSQAGFDVKRETVYEVRIAGVGPAGALGMICHGRGDCDR